MNISSNSTIFLVDSKYDLEEIVNVTKQQISTIITFDYNSHKFFLHKNIEHETSDDYLNKIELQEIQRTSYQILDWCHKSEISTLLEYEGVNIGDLFAVELHYVLIPFLKKFVEIKNIFEKHSDAKFMTASTLYTMMLSFTNSVTELKNIRIESQHFLYDSLKLNVKIGKNSYGIRLPRSYYVKLKKISEKIIHMLFESQKPANKKPVMLIEFDTIKYETLFTNLPQTSLNLITLCRRRPSIWNLKSFSIIRKSGATVATYYGIDTTKLRELIDNDRSELKKKLDHLFVKDELISPFFTIKGVSFWKIFKPIFVRLAEKRSLEAISEIQITKQILEKYNPKSVVIWSENGFNEQIVMGLAKQRSIPVILFQHGGVIYDSAGAYDYNRFAGILPINSDKYIAWGESLKQYLINNGIESMKIHTTGSPLYDKIFTKKPSTSKSKQDFILLTTSSHIQNFVNNLTVATMIEYEEAIKKICQTVKKLNKRLVIKLHPFQEEIDITKIAKELDPTITIVKQGDVFPLIEACEALITIDASSTILEAQILEKPTISVSVKNFGFGEPTIFRDNPHIKTDVDNLENLLNMILSDANFRNQIIESGTNFVKTSLANRGMASQTMLSFLEKC